MNREAQEELDRILKLDPAGLTSTVKAFLKARADYLTTDQKRIFASVFEEKKVEAEAEKPVKEEKPKKK